MTILINRNDAIDQLIAEGYQKFELELSGDNTLTNLYNATFDSPSDEPYYVIGDLYV